MYNKYEVYNYMYIEQIRLWDQLVYRKLKDKEYVIISVKESYFGNMILLVEQRFMEIYIL